MDGNNNIMGTSRHPGIHCRDCAQCKERGPFLGRTTIVHKYVNKSAKETAEADEIANKAEGCVSTPSVFSSEKERRLLGIAS